MQSQYLCPGSLTYPQPSQIVRWWDGWGYKRCYSVPKSNASSPLFRNISWTRTNYMLGSMVTFVGIFNVYSHTKSFWLQSPWFQPLLYPVQQGAQSSCTLSLLVICSSIINTWVGLISVLREVYSKKQWAIRTSLNKWDEIISFALSTYKIYSQRDFRHLLWESLSRWTSLHSSLLGYFKLQNPPHFLFC